MEGRTNETKRWTVVPACSISEDGGEVTLKVEMPGVGKEDLEVKIEGNALSIEGRRKAFEDGGSYLLHERRATGFRKSFTLDDSIDHEKVSADLVDGILTLKLQVKEAAKPRRIAIG
jgi:HSP20 family protein